MSKIIHKIKKQRWLDEVSCEIEVDERWKSFGFIWHVTVKSIFDGQPVDTTIIISESGHMILTDIWDPYSRRIFTLGKHSLKRLAEVIATILITKYFEIATNAFYPSSSDMRYLDIAKTYTSCVFKRKVLSSAWEFVVTAEIEKRTNDLTITLYWAQPRLFVKGDFNKVATAFKAILLERLI